MARRGDVDRSVQCTASLFAGYKSCWPENMYVLSCFVYNCTFVQVYNCTFAHLQIVTFVHLYICTFVHLHICTFAAYKFGWLENIYELSCFFTIVHLYNCILYICTLYIFTLYSWPCVYLNLNICKCVHLSVCTFIQYNVPEKHFHIRTFSQMYICTIVHWYKCIFVSLLKSV